MQDAVASFAIRLVAGLAVSCWLLSAPRQRVVAPYFRIQLLLLLGLAVLFGLADSASNWAWSAALGGAAYIGSVLWALEKRTAGRVVFFLMAAVSIAWLVNHALSQSPEVPVSSILLVGDALASAATLGAAMSAMLLGHRYLTAPGMPLEPLHWANRALGGAAVARLVASGWELALGAGLLTESTFVVWVALRWLAGILGLFVVCGMVQRILVFKNTQSATGVLFVGVILTFIGELTAEVLSQAVGFPF